MTPYIMNYKSRTGFIADILYMIVHDISALALQDKFLKALSD